MTKVGSSSSLVKVFLSLLLFLLSFVITSSALADVGEEWVFGIDSPVYPDPNAQQIPRVSGDNPVWQGRLSNIDRIYYKDLSRPADPAYLLTAASSSRISGGAF